MKSTRTTTTRIHTTHVSSTTQPSSRPVSAAHSTYSTHNTQHTTNTAQNPRQQQKQQSQVSTNLHKLRTEATHFQRELKKIIKSSKEKPFKIDLNALDPPESENPPPLTPILPPTNEHPYKNRTRLPQTRDDYLAKREESGSMRDVVGYGLEEAVVDRARSLSPQRVHVNQSETSASSPRRLVSQVMGSLDDIPDLSSYTRHKDSQTRSHKDKKGKVSPKKDVLLKDDEYFDQLQAFRESHPHWCFTIYPPSLTMDDEHKQDADRHASDKRRKDASALAQKLADRRHLTSGYFSVNARYFPTKSVNPFIQDMRLLEYYDLVDDEESAFVCEGVKVSIPHKHRQPVRRAYRLRTREDYEPGDSVNFQDYLHSGYAPFHHYKRSTAKTTKANEKSNENNKSESANAEYAGPSEIISGDMSFKRTVQMNQRRVWESFKQNVIQK